MTFGHKLRLSTDVVTGPPNQLGPVAEPVYVPHVRSLLTQAHELPLSHLQLLVETSSGANTVEFTDEPEYRDVGDSVFYEERGSVTHAKDDAILAATPLTCDDTPSTSAAILPVTPPTGMAILSPIAIAIACTVLLNNNTFY